MDRKQSTNRQKYKCLFNNKKKIGSKNIEYTVFKLKKVFRLFLL